MKALIVIAFRDFQDMEYAIPKKILEEAGIKTKTISNKQGMAIGVFGGTVKIDQTISEIDVSDYSSLIFIGGGGCLSNLDNDDSYRIIKEASSQNIILGSICIAPIILAKAGVLKNKKATAWKSPMNQTSIKIFKENGVTYQDEPVIIDKEVVTASGPLAANLFGKAILNLLTKK